MEFRARVVFGSQASGGGVEWGGGSESDQLIERINYFTMLNKLAK